jgi:ABC-type dipeptide/oligopeptide/nickel transport system permease component
VGAYIVKRIASALVILFLDVVLIFSLIHLTPGDPALMIVSGEMGVNAENVTISGDCCEATWAGHSLIINPFSRCWSQGFP